MAAESENLTPMLGSLSAPGRVASDKGNYRGRCGHEYVCGEGSPFLWWNNGKSRGCPSWLEELDPSLAARMAPGFLFRPGVEPRRLKGTYMSVQWP